MIERKTVFILGAGASAAYGFPIGKALTQKISSFDIGKAFKAATNPPGETHSSLWKYIFDKYDESNIFEFFEAFKKSDNPSVDAFIEHRPEFLTIGKILISLELIKCENENNLINANPKGHWYQYLFGKLRSKFEEFNNNNVSFITFNYDRSFEQYLLNCMKYTYGKSDKEVAEKLSSIPIIHLYDSLGTLPVFTNDEKSRDYETRITPEIIETCIDNIKIIHEDIDLKKDVEFNKAYELISEADMVCFLGFGYDETNLSRLNLLNILTRDHYIFGSTFGFVEAEVNKIKSLVTPFFSRKMFADESGKLNCLDYLRSIADFI